MAPKAKANHLVNFIPGKLDQRSEWDPRQDDFSQENSICVCVCVSMFALLEKQPFVSLDIKLAGWRTRLLRSPRG